MSDAGRRPRGRPQRLPFDTTAPVQTTVEGDKRLAWLLACSRILGPRRDVARADFVELLRSAGLRADSSRISRWESGLEALSPALVEAYERATGSAPGSLIAIRQMLARGRHLRLQGAARGVPTPPAASELDQLMDRVTHQTMRGEHWLRLSRLLAGFDHVYLHPRVWRTTTDLLVDELGRSAGLAHLRRFEAAVALLGDDVARPHLSRSVGRAVLEPGTQVAARILPVIGELPDGAARDLLLRLTAGSDGHVAASAARVVSRMAGEGLAPAEDAVLQRYLADAAARARAVRRPYLPEVVVDLACHLDDDAFAGFLLSVRDVADTAALTQTRATREGVGTAVARTVSDRVARAAEAAHGRDGMDADRMLRTLIREALFHAHGHRRSLATSILLASPYACTLGEAVIDLTHHESDEVARAAWGFTTRLSGTLRVDQIAPRVLSERRRDLRVPVLAALAQARGPLDELTAERTAKTALEDDEPAALAAVAVLGMHRRHDLLPTGASAQVGAAAGWWSGSEGAIHED